MGHPGRLPITPDRHGGDGPGVGSGVVARRLPAMTGAAGWYPDPTDPARWAWWDGAHWSATASPGDPTDPAEEARWFPRLRALRWPALVVALTSTLLIVVMNVFGGGNETDPSKVDAWTFVVGIGSLAFLGVGVPLLAWGSSHWFGSGRVTRDLGLRVRWIDLPLGVAGAVTLWGVSLGLTLLTEVVGLPQGSNTDAIADQMRDNPEAAFVLFLLVLATAAILAPISEEILFRGMLYRGLVDKVPGWAAVVIQGVVFGCAHVIPNLGWANVALLTVLCSLGVCLGFLARLTGRLGACVIAHALFNASSVVLLYLSVR